MAFEKKEIPNEERYWLMELLKGLDEMDIRIPNRVVPWEVLFDEEREIYFFGLERTIRGDDLSISPEPYRMVLNRRDVVYVDIWYWRPSDPRYGEFERFDVPEGISLDYVYDLLREAFNIELSWKRVLLPRVLDNLKKVYEQGGKLS